MKTYLPLIAVFASTFAYAQLADSTGAGRLHMSPPIASEGGSCNTSEVKSDANGNILYCQSGRWKPTQDTGGKGILGLMKPFRGMTTACVADGYPNGSAYFKATVDINGNVTLIAGDVTCFNTLACQWRDRNKASKTVTLDSFGITGVFVVDAMNTENGWSSFTHSCRGYFPL